MRILEIAPPWFSVPPAGYGGIEWIVALLADGLADAGHDVTLLASGGSTTRAKLRTVFDRPPSLEIGDPWLEALHVLTGYLERERYDVIHDHSGVTGLLLGALLDGPPVVHTVHGPWVDKVAAMHRMLAGRLHVVAISADQASRAPAEVPIAGVVPNGIPVDRFVPRLEPRGESGYLAFVGRANHEKGPEVAVEVARRLGRPLKMLVKVNEPAERAYWDRIVAPRLSDADVEVLPPMNAEDKAGLYAGADATLFPIQWAEPFGLVMVESMACGTPVVGFANGAAPEVVSDRETGFLAEPGDVDALCAAVRRVAELDRAACRRRAEKCFSGEAMVAGYEAVFARITGERASVDGLDPYPSASDMSPGRPTHATSPGASGRRRPGVSPAAGPR